MEVLSLDETSGQAEETGSIGSHQGSRWDGAVAVLQDGAVAREGPWRRRSVGGESRCQGGNMRLFLAGIHPVLAGNPRGQGPGGPGREDRSGAGPNRRIFAGR